jgi:hypothetical protein
LVLTAVSSINTSRAGSSIPCSRIQRRRAGATSAPCRSAACRLFFEGDAMPAEKTPKRTAAGSNPPLAPLRNGLHQSQVRVFGNQSQYSRRALLQWRNASSPRLRRSAPALVPALQPSDCRTHADIEAVGHSRRDALISTASITRSRRSPESPHPPKERINAQRLAHP